MAQLSNFQETNDGAVLYFTGTTINETAEKIKNLFIGQGYKLEEGTFINAVYGIGNATLRILFGAFVKRYKFRIDVTLRNELVTVEFNKAMSGLSGGVIGMSKLKKEKLRLIELLKII
jgi:hypothetical protein